MEAIVISIVSALVIALSTYVSKAPKGEKFEPKKIARTVIIGIVLGGLSYYKGYDLTAENWETYMAANAGIIAVADQAVKFVIRLVTKE